MSSFQIRHPNRSKKYMESAKSAGIHDWIIFVDPKTRKSEKEMSAISVPEGLSFSIPVEWSMFNGVRIQEGLTAIALQKFKLNEYRLFDKKSVNEIKKWTEESEDPNLFFLVGDFHVATSLLENLVESKALPNNSIGFHFYSEDTEPDQFQMLIIKKNKFYKSIFNAGWIPFGPERKLTLGSNRSMVLKMDGIKPTELVRKYLGKDKIDIDSLRLLPLGLMGEDRKQVIETRTAVKLIDTDHVEYSGPLSEKLVYRFLHTSSEDSVKLINRTISEITEGSNMSLLAITNEWPQVKGDDPFLSIEKKQLQNLNLAFACDQIILFDREAGVRFHSIGIFGGGW